MTFQKIGNGGEGALSSFHDSIIGKGRTQGGVGVEPPPLVLGILQKLYYLRKGD